MINEYQFKETCVHAVPKLLKTKEKEKTLKVSEN